MFRLLIDLIRQDVVSILDGSGNEEVIKVSLFTEITVRRVDGKVKVP